jgi:hypothetical protein
MTVSMLEPTRADVALHYVVRPAGAHAVTVAALAFAPATFSDVEVIVEGRASPLALEPGAGLGAHKLGGTVPLPAGAGDTIAFDIRYAVVLPASAGRESRIRLPVVAVMWPPAEALPGTFAVTLDVRADAHIRGAFPSLLRETALTSAARSYGADMQVVPSMIAFDLGGGDPPRLTLEAMLDAGVIALLLLFAVLGWRHVRAQDR